MNPYQTPQSPQPASVLLPYQQPVYQQPPQPYPPQGFVAAPPVYIQPYRMRPARDPRLTAAGRTFNFLCLAVLLQTVSAIVFEIPAVAVSRLLQVDLLENNVLYQMFLSAMVPLSTALPLFLYMKVSRRTAVDSLRFEKVGFGISLLCVLAGLGICMLANYPAFYIQDFFSQFGYEAASQIDHSEDTWLMFTLELFSTAILVPVMEEFAFRGVLLSTLRRYGAGFAVIASSLVFSLVHMDFANVVFALIAGLVFGFLYVRTDNLWITVCIHALNNGIAVVGNYSDLLFGPNSDLADDLLLYIPILAGTAALLILLLFCRSALTHRSQPEPQSDQPWPVRALSFGEGAGCVVRAPLFWVIVAMMAAYTTTLFF